MVFAWWTQTQHFLQTKRHALCRLISVLTKSCPVTRFTSSVRSLHLSRQTFFATWALFVDCCFLSAVRSFSVGKQLPRCVLAASSFWLFFRGGKPAPHLGQVQACCSCGNSVDAVTNKVFSSRNPMTLSLSFLWAWTAWLDFREITLRLVLPLMVYLHKLQVQMNCSALPSVYRGAFGRLFSPESFFHWRIARSSWPFCERLHGSDSLSFDPRRDLSMGLWWFQPIWFSLWAQPAAASIWFTYFAGLFFPLPKRK